LVVVLPVLPELASVHVGAPVAVGLLTVTVAAAESAPTDVLASRALWAMARHVSPDPFTGWVTPAREASLAAELMLICAANTIP